MFSKVYNFEKNKKVKKKWKTNTNKTKGKINGENDKYSGREKSRETRVCTKKRKRNEVITKKEKTKP